MPPFLYTAHHVAEALKVPVRDVYRWIEEGRLPAYKDGHDWVIKAEDYDNFLLGPHEEDRD